MPIIAIPPASSPRRGCARWISALSLLLVGCGERRDPALDEIAAAIEDGKLRADLQRHFDANRECVAVLYTDYRTGLIVAAPGSPAARALVEGGLIEAAGPGVDGNQSYRPAPAAAKWFAKQPGGRMSDNLLCFAKRQIDYLSASHDGNGWTVQYVFKLVDGADWLRSSAMRAAFPRMAEAFNVRFVGPEQLVLRNGSFNPEQIAPALGYAPYYSFDINFRPHQSDSGNRIPHAADPGGE